MKVKELYRDAMDNEQQTLLLVLDYLIKERQVLSLDDDKSKLDYYLQDRFKDKMNEYLKEYKER